VPELNDFVGGFKILLKPKGVLTIEFPHLLRLMEGVQFDTVYHEHFSYFSFLAAEKLITDKENVSFSLTADGLIVNGKKQPDALFTQARDKYLKDPGDKIVYSKKGSSESFSINRK